jgi:enoyl-CoA hydratase/carnithine racemase
MTDAYQTLITRSIDGTIALVLLNRPGAANALNTTMAQELKDFLHNIDSERVVILTGSGHNFCAGADLKERKGMDEVAWQTQHHAFEEALTAIMECPIPVIAAVNGAAFGGGLELALACDFIYAAGTARFALTEVTLGIMPGLGGTQQLPRRIGMSQAKELIFTGQAFSAIDAQRWGMVNKLCPPEALLSEVTATARAISANAPLSVKAVKESINQGINLPIEEALQCELSYYETLLNTNDRHEGINAFNEKRKAAFTGE